MSNKSHFDFDFDFDYAIDNDSEPEIVKKCCWINLDLLKGEKYECNVTNEGNMGVECDNCCDVWICDWHNAKEMHMSYCKHCGKLLH